MPLSQDLLQKISSDEFVDKNLDLFYETLNDADMAQLCDALKTNTHITRIVFCRGNSFTTISLKNLLSLTQINALVLHGYPGLDLAGINLLAQSEHLKSLNLNANGFGDEVPKIFAACESKIEDLSLTHCGIGLEGAKALATLPHLKKLNLLWNSLSDDGVIALTQNKNLVELNLMLNQVSSKGVEALTEIPSLECLKLCDPIGDSAMQALVSLPKLRCLSLHACGISDVGAEILAKQSQVDELFLSQNFITDKGAAYLAENICLRKLDLSKNALGENGVALFANNMHILDLDLSDNQRVKDHNVFELFLENPVLQRLNFFHPSEPVRNSIKAKLHQNLLDWQQWIADVFDISSLGIDLTLEILSYFESKKTVLECYGDRCMSLSKI